MIYRFGEFELDEEGRQLRRNGEPIFLQPLIFSLLALLVRNHRRVVSKDELLDTLWPDAMTSEASLQRAISLTRSALNDSSHDLIRTFTGYGYRFAVRVEVDAGEGEPEPPASAGGAAPPPQIRYAQTSDDISIAFWDLGEGPALVYIPNLIWSHGELEWRFPEIRHWYEQLGRTNRVVRLDPRGTGSSQRSVAEYSLPVIQRDVEAVVDHLGLDGFALFGDLNSGPVAMRYAARNPDRISHLILWHTYAKTADIAGPKMTSLESLQALVNEDWETFTETRAHMGFGWSDGESAHRYADLMRRCVSPEMALTSYDAGRADDVTQLLPQIKTPTLILHRRHFYFWDVGVSQDLAARIGNARLIVLQGAGSAPFLGGSDAVVQAIRSFLRPT